MTHEERCELVAACKYVYKVIPNAPCVPGGLNEEFLMKHNIHIVGCGEVCFYGNKLECYFMSN
jgi:glycerol-3-phosphate cytidylyltransferase-like family protein